MYVKFVAIPAACKKQIPEPNLRAQAVSGDMAQEAAKTIKDQESP